MCLVVTYPLLGGHDDLTLSTLRIPRVGALEASVRDTRETRSRGEDVGVCAQKDAGHHGAGRSSSDVDEVGIDAVVRDRVADLGDDTQRVTTSVVRERRVGVHVPASGGVMS